MEQYMNWFKTAQKFNYLYVSIDDYPSYKEGLKINQKNKYTIANSWTKNVYNLHPIYLALETKNDKFAKVDV